MLSPSLDHTLCQSPSTTLPPTQGLFTQAEWDWWLLNPPRPGKRILLLLGGSVSLSEALTLKFHPHDKAFRGGKVFLRAKHTSARTCDCSLLLCQGPGGSSTSRYHQHQLQPTSATSVLSTTPPYGTHNFARKTLR